MIPKPDSSSLPKTEILKERLTGLLDVPVDLTITDNLHSIITVKRHPSVFIFRLHRIFLNAGENVLHALARWASGPRRRINRIVQDFIDQNQEAIAKSAKRRKPKRINLVHQGRFFNLLEALQRVQQDYFGADLNLRVTWGAVRKKPGRRHIRLGSYSAQKRLIRINPILDQSFVPAYVVDDILYHEILHHYLGNRELNGRTCTHYAAFRKLEKEFQHHRASKIWIKQNLPLLIRRKK